jgi:hypothetical protein
MAIATTKLTAGWCFRSRGRVQDVYAFRVAQGRTVQWVMQGAQSVGAIVGGMLI